MEFRSLESEGTGQLVEALIVRGKSEGPIRPCNGSIESEISELLAIFSRVSAFRGVFGGGWRAEKGVGWLEFKF